MIEKPSYEELFEILTNRYRGADSQAILRVLSPIMIPIHTLDKTVFKIKGQNHNRASFSVLIDNDNDEIRDFAFARSVSSTEKPYGLPHATNYSDYVHQNPVCEIGNDSWFETIDEVWELS